jgi:hypothetical protein
VAQGGERFLWTRYVRYKEQPPRAMVTGSGAPVLDASRKQWLRTLMRRVHAVDRGVASPFLVSDYLAKLIHGAHNVLGAHGTVGPTSIVLWRFRARSGLPGGGGAYYDGETREEGRGYSDVEGDRVPTISNGMDINAVAGVMMEQVMPGLVERLLARVNGEDVPEFVVDKDALHRELAKLPETPDEKLQ